MPQNPTRQVHALLGNLPADQNLCRKKTTPQTRPNFTPDFIFDQNRKLWLAKTVAKKTNFTLNQNNCRNEKIFYADQNACWKKDDLYFYQNLCQAKTSRFWKPTQPTTNKAEVTKQSFSKPSQAETLMKNLEADFSDSTKPTRTYASEENTAKRKRRELENLLAEKNIDQKLYFEKRHR